MVFVLTGIDGGSLGVCLTDVLSSFSDALVANKRTRLTLLPEL
jgi:hypothetical protein